MKHPDRQPCRPRYLLAEMPTLAPELVQKLKSQWVESVEEFLAIAATPGGGDGLKNLLNIDDSQMERLMRALTNAVGEETARTIRRDTAIRGALGALLTEEQKRRFGIRDEASKETGHE